MTSRYEFRFSDDPQDEEWDAFVAETPGGHHVQTSLWAQVKATVGMQTFRVLATDHGQLVAGGQVLIRSLPIVGAVGYVSRGPLVATGDPGLSESLLSHLRDAACARGVRHLTVQPPTTDPEMVGALEREGFLPTAQTVAPVASVVVDLSQSPDEMMAKMHRKTRYNIRLAGRRGITVRSGGESDLDAYCRMVEATAQRQGFRPYPSEYYTTMWRVLEPRGYLRFSVVEHEGEVIAAQFAIPFGNTVLNKLGVWSGRSGKHHPNEALHWDTMQWSRNHGYSLYDFEGIDLQVAEALSGGESLSPDSRHSVTDFKLGFGGDVRLFPGAYFTASSAIVRRLYGAALPRVSDWRTVRRGVTMLRTGAGRGSGMTRGDHKG